MIYRPKSTAFASRFASLKQASLFYPHVFPVYMRADESPEGRVPLEKLLPPASGFKERVVLESKFFDQLWPQSSGFDEAEKYSYVYYKAFEMMLLAGFHGGGWGKQDREVIEPAFRVLTELFGRDFVGLLRDNVKDLNSYFAILGEIKKRALPDTEFEAIDGQSNSEFHDSLEGADPCFVLANVEIVDADSLTWEQILTIREDPESSKRLRNLKTFFFDEFDGKPITYIEDKLGGLMDKYRAAAEKHGAVLARTNFSVVSSKELLTGASAGLLAAVTGTMMPIAAAIGVVATLGSYLLEVRAVRQKAKDELAIAPVRYLIDIESHVDRNQKN